MSIKYFPQHFRRTRSYAATLPTVLAGMSKSSVAVREMEHATTDAIGREYIKNLDRALSPSAAYLQLISSGAFLTEGLAAQSHAQFEINGKHIFDVDSFLVAELKDSDGDEITIADLKPQFLNFYVHVGAQDDIVFAGGVIFEGAYVLVDPISWRITLCGRRPGKWWDRPSDVHTLRLPSVIFQSPLNVAIEEALDIDRKDLFAAQAGMSGNSATSPSMNTAVDLALKSHFESTDALKKAMNLIAQVLAYVASYGEDSREGWQDETPEKMRMKADSNANQKERERNESKLTSMGFWRVFKVGKDFSAANLAANQSMSRAPHSRRAHWRNQAHGPRHSLRKLIWIYRTRILGREVP